MDAQKVKVVTRKVVTRKKVGVPKASVPKAGVRKVAPTQKVSMPKEEVATPKQKVVANAKWYIVKTKSNCENKARQAIQRLIKDNKCTSQVQEILVPEKEVVDVVKGKKVTRFRRVYPGYIFINMDLTNALWHLIKGASHVINFIGKKGIPAEVPQEQIEKITQKITEAQPQTLVSFAVGEAVKVIDGPFKTFSGLVEEVNQEKGRVKVSVSIFGRPTPIELDFAQVHREE